jgi:hypothetical protein
MSRTTALLRVAAILAAAVALLLGTVTGAAVIGGLLYERFGGSVAVWTYAIGLMLLACVAPIIAAGVWAVFRRHADLE